MKLSKEAVKAKFLASLKNAPLAKLMECELTLKVTIAAAKAGSKFASNLPELLELEAAVKAAKSKF